MPTELGLLTYLEKLSFDSSKVTGQIPSQLGHLVLLKSWELRTTRISTSLPSELGTLSSLTGYDGFTWGDWDDVTFFGSMPSELASLYAFSFEDDVADSMTGTIPTVRPPIPRLPVSFVSKSHAHRP